LAPVTAGEIVFDGQSLRGMRAHEIARRGIAHVPEGRHIFGPMTVEDNLMLGRQRMGGYTVADGLAFVYDILPKLKERRTQAAGSLSGGEQQMVAIGRAIIGQPKLLMLDEPSMGLAPQIVDAVFELLERLRRAGQTVLLVEQNVELALDLADRCIVLNAGDVQIAGTSAQLRARQDIVDAYLGVLEN
jgi:branched-chain amino acid transport system ATP-binding protein